MTGTLFKKQMMEMFSFFWQNKKKNKNRTGVGLVLALLFYLSIIGMLAVMFYFAADLICEPMVDAGLDWLYFALTGSVGIAMGAFGSVFNTYSSLYLAKDNEFLLAMPVPPVKILMVRLSGVYVMGLLYEMLVMIPVLIRYFLAAPAGLSPRVCSVLFSLVLSVVVLILSTVLGWCVALISTKAKHKSMITVVLSLGFIAGYYYLYAKAMGVLQNIVADPLLAGDFVKNRFSPLYYMGMAASGKTDMFLIFTAAVMASLGILCLLLAVSYRKLLTAGRGESRTKYREKQSKVRSVNGALLIKEFRRFYGSPNYMLNCGLGIIMMLIASVALLIKQDLVTEILGYLPQEYQAYLYLAVTAAICAMTSMNDMTAPSVSLEGKNLWILQTVPVNGSQVLMAKLKMQLILTLIPAAVLIASVFFVLKPDPVSAVLVLTVAILFILLMASFGLAVNLKMPNLTWTNEIVPIKQSFGVAATLLGGWALVAGLGGLYYLLRSFIQPLVYLAFIALVLLVLSLILLRWLTHRGARIFETL